MMPELNINRMGNMTCRPVLFRNRSWVDAFKACLACLQRRMFHAKLTMSCHTMLTDVGEWQKKREMAIISGVLFCMVLCSPSCVLPATRKRCLSMRKSEHASKILQHQLNLALGLLYRSLQDSPSHMREKTSNAVCAHRRASYASLRSDGGRSSARKWGRGRGWIP